MVEDIVRPRGSADALDPKLPDADLLIRWTARPADVVDTPLGRIGPMPFQRTGSHVERGFLVACGPGMSPETAPASGHALDLAPG
jgi:hypothetical protein